MEPTHNCSEELRIELRIVQKHSDATLILDICFQNTGDKPYVLAFSNRSRKAELLGLRVFDEKTHPIAPERRDVISLKNSKIEEHIIAPGSEWIYRLTGEIRGGFVEFQGAAYKFPPSQRMNCFFEFKETKSNVVIISDLSEG